MSDARLLLVCIVACVAACACSESRREEASVFDGCFAGRELESWDEKLVQVCETHVDLDADGRIDQRLVNEYDEQGRLIAMSAGAVLLSETEYSDDGRTVTRSSYAPGGTLRSQDVSTYDEAFNLLSNAQDEDGDGEVDSITTHDYGCWEEANERLPGPCFTESDWGADGELDERTSREYDSEGRIVLYASEDLSNGERSVTTFKYGERSERQETDSDDDGIIDGSSGYDYDADGNTLRKWADRDGDGIVEQSTEYEYDDHGRSVLEVILDAQAPVARKALRYEDDGRRVFETTVYEDNPDLNGAVERRYDGAGNLLVTAIDDLADGTLDSCTYVSYACWAE